MKTTETKTKQQAEIARLARVATGPQVGESDFWKQVMSHLDAIGSEHQLVKPKTDNRPK